MTNTPARLLGCQPFRPLPIAGLTSRGTVRTRKPVPRLCQVYPTGSPPDRQRDGHVVASVACLRHSGDIRLAELPPGRCWAEVGRLMMCTACGTPGVVNIVPNWLHHRDHLTPYSARWRADPPE